MVNDDRRGRDGHADEGIQGHGRGQAERLAEHLVALRVGVTGEVGNVERQRGPEADHRGRAREEKRPELAGLSPPASNFDGWLRIGPNPSASRAAQASSASPRAIKSGALMFSRKRIESMPR